MASSERETEADSTVESLPPERERDLQRWRSTYALLAEVAGNDTTAVARSDSEDGQRAARPAELRTTLESLTRTRDVRSFLREMDRWSGRPGPFNQFEAIGTTWLTQLVQHHDGRERDLADLLVEVCHTPQDDEQAAARIVALEEAVRPHGQSTAPVLTMLSCFWSTDEHAAPAWPAAWAPAVSSFLTLGWMGRHMTHAERYIAFAQLCREFAPHGPRDAARLMSYLELTTPFVGIGHGLPQTCEEATALAVRHDPIRGYPEPEQEARAAGLVRPVSRGSHRADPLSAPASGSGHRAAAARNQPPDPGGHHSRCAVPGRSACDVVATRRARRACVAGVGDPLGSSCRPARRVGHVYPRPQWR